MTIEKLPDANEIAEIIDKFISRPLVEEFFKERGIILASRNRQAYASFAKRLFLSYEDYEELHDLATSGAPTKSIAGIDIYVPTDGSVEDNVLDDFGEWLDTNAGEALTISEIIQEDGRLSGRISQTRRSLGKQSLLKNIVTEVSFEVRQIIANHYHIIYYPERVTDLTIFKQLVDGALGKSYDVIVPTITGLEHEKQIGFFDAFLEYNFRDWRLDDVTEVKLRAPADNDTDLDETEDENEQASDELIEKERLTLASIREADLKGGSLRTNPFVKEFEKSGHFFQSMTFKLSHAKNPVVIELVVQFKLKPTTLEINLAKSCSTNPDDEGSPLSKTKQNEYLAYFWEVGRQILSDLRK